MLNRDWNDFEWRRGGRTNKLRAISSRTWILFDQDKQKLIVILALGVTVAAIVPARGWGRRRTVLEKRIYIYISVFAGDALALIRGGLSQIPLSEAEVGSGPRRIVVGPNWGRRVVRRG